MNICTLKEIDQREIRQAETEVGTYTVYVVLGVSVFQGSKQKLYTDFYL